MSATSYLIQDNKEQEEVDIFDELEDYDGDEDDNVEKSEKDMNKSKLISTPQFRDMVKSKARQQLAVSIDSPFSKEIDPAELRRLKEERAAILREETHEIRRQLELVKNRLNELKSSADSSDKYNENNNLALLNKEKSERIHDNPLIVSNKVVDNSNFIRSKNVSTSKKVIDAMPKFRPLTGSADCPNCVCDRRTSVCDNCIGVAIVAPQPSKSASSSNHFTKQKENSKQFYNDPDERPIRPAKDRTLGTVVEVLDDVVVPGKVYTISKSLNEKRSKLAQTIDALENLMDKVREKEDRLDKERKIVKLYKDQWQYGPNIGGPPATTRDRLDNASTSKRNYESRLDANLVRDTKSLMGFQHVESGLKLRQYDSNIGKATFRRPMTSSKQNYPLRSRSLESLRITAQKKKQEKPHVLDKRTTVGPKIINSRIINNNRKSSSEINLSTVTSAPKLDSIKAADSLKDKVQSNFEKDEEQQEEVEEILDESIVDADEVEDIEDDGKAATANNVVDSNNSSTSKAKENESNKKFQKMTWIPVFGETEIKQVKSMNPKRKVQIVSPDNNINEDDNKGLSSSQMLSQHNRMSNISPSFKRNNFKRQDLSLVNRRPERNNNNNSISNYNIITGVGGSDARTRNEDSMREARQTLKAASNLLEQEQRDSKTKNQLIIRKRTITPIKPKSTFNNNNSRHQQQQQQQKEQHPSYSMNSSNNRENGDTIVKTFVTPTDREIARLEEKVNEQQKLLEKLAQSRDRTLVSPVTVTCSSPCCHFQHSSGSNQNLSNKFSSNYDQRSSTPPSNKQLISTLRDRLQKTKLKLTKTLEEEIEKHNQLKESVDYSLKKQTNLENQNEILKQSLNRCIDKCLKDLSNTFEWLNDNLNNSTVLSRITSTATSCNENGKDNCDNVFLISNATQLMRENKHLKQMKNHIDTIERQRKVIFEELSKEKQRSNQLESQLKQNQNELKQLLEAKQKLESQFIDMTSHVNQTKARRIDNKTEEEKQNNLEDSSSQNKNEHLLLNKDLNQPSSTSLEKPPSPITTNPTTSNGNIQSNSSNNQQSTSFSQIDTNTHKSDLDDSYNSIDLYRRYIQSMSPDIESIKRERKLIIKEFDNIKKNAHRYRQTLTININKTML